MCDERESMMRMHITFLDALRHREQDILRYLGILAPALVGFVWLLTLKRTTSEGELAFAGGTIAVIGLLFLGAMYSLALGYNYRYLTVQVAKLEASLNVRNNMLLSWSHNARDFVKRYRIGIIPWCAPPDIIKVFWVAFLVGIAGVTLTAELVPPATENSNAEILMGYVSPVGWMCFLVAFSGPVWCGRKITRTCAKEPDEWLPID